MDIFVVHYKKLTERRKYLESIFSQMPDVIIHWFDEIDRDTLKPEHLAMYKEDPQKWAYMNSIWHSTKSPSRILNKAEIACAVTHLLVYKFIVDYGIEKALILEDDVIFLHNPDVFIEKINKIKKENFDMCWISDYFGWTVENFSMYTPNMHIDPYLASLNKNVITDDRYIYPMPCNKSSDAYLISNKCAKILLQEIVPFCLPIDWNHTPIILEHKLKNYWTVEPLVSQGSFSVYGSSTAPSSSSSSSSIPPLSVAEIKYYKTFNIEIPDTKYQYLKNDMQRVLTTLCNKINNRDNFVLVKFGDGEFRNMISTNEEEYNCDGNNYYPELGTDLIKAYIYFLSTDTTTTTTYINRWHSHVYTIQQLLDSIYGKNAKFVYYDLIVHKLPFDNDIVFFFKLIKNSKREKIYISNRDNIKHICPVLKIDAAIEIPSVNSYKYKNEIFASVKEFMTTKKDAIVLVSGGMFSKILIADCMNNNPQNTYIDLGSTFDGIYRASRDFNTTEQYKTELFKIYM